jgi:predicted PurR-regulated permease PerM
VTLGAWAIGLDSPVLLGAVSGFPALTPIDPPLVYVPASVWLILQGRIVGGLLFLGWGIFVVSMVDPVAIALLLTLWRDWTAAR